MSRNKAYNEQEVLEKAMNLFWKNGYATTSMLQLEKEMGINKFSIYSSFGSKMGLMQASIKCYAQKLNALVVKLQNRVGGADAIQQYFYDFIHFSKENNLQKGCLITNTANECIEENNTEIQQLLGHYTANIKDVFATKLREDNSYSEEEVQQKADFLFMAMFGFSSASKIFTNAQLDNYIYHIFKNV
jgi:AcrR family transcriptional regulator